MGELPGAEEGSTNQFWLAAGLGCMRDRGTERLNRRQAWLTEQVGGSHRPP
jgi:hypothetical protein